MTSRRRAYLWFGAAACFAVVAILQLARAQHASTDAVTITLDIIVAILFSINGVRDYRKSA